MSRKQRRTLGAMAIGVALILISFACCMMAIFPNKLVSVGERHARTKCEEWITQQSVTGVVRFLEDTNADSDLGDYHYTIMGIVEADSALGVTRRVHYTCRLHSEITGVWYKWELDGMDYR